MRGATSKLGMSSEQRAPSLGAQFAAMEAELWETVDDMDDRDVAETVRRVQRIPKPPAVLEAHCAQLWSGNTADGTKLKIRAWDLAVRTLYGEDLSLDAMNKRWPPTREAWVAFLVALRLQVLSYKRFRGVVGTFCLIAKRHFGVLRGVPPDSMDPSMEHRLAHAATCKTMARECGLKLRQVQGIDQSEASSGVFWADADTLKGLSQAAAWAVGCLLGGRRPRSLTAIKMRHVQFRAQRVVVDGRYVLVPAVAVEFPEEKFDDEQGARSQTESYDRWEDYGALFESHGCSIWLYRQCVLRGAFEGEDPIKGAKAGDVLCFKPGAMDWYLFCQVSHDTWVNTVPIGVNTLGDWTKTLLKRMGRPGRGFSAHRRGFVTRACIHAVLRARAKGEGIPHSVMDLIVRAGGWQGVTGIMTVLRTYADKVLDLYTEGATLSLGRVPSAYEVEGRISDYAGTPRRPPAPCTDRPSSGHMQLRLQAWRSPEVLAHQQRLDDAGSLLMAVALKHPGINPVHRYLAHRESFSVMRSRYPAEKLVLEYKELFRGALPVFKSALKQATMDCAAAYASLTGASRARGQTDRHFIKQACASAIAALQPVCLGHVLPSGDLSVWGGVFESGVYGFRDA